MIVMEKYFNVAHRFGPLLARILIGGMFIMSGVQKIFAFEGTVFFTESVGMPYPAVAVVLAILFEVLGGLSILLGWKIQYGAIALILYTALASYYFHSNFADQIQMAFFIKNMAIIGGLLYMTAFGAGHFSLGKKEHMHQESMQSLPPQSPVV